MRLTFGAAEAEDESGLPGSESPAARESEVSPGGNTSGGTPKRRGRPPGSTNKTSLDTLEKRLTEKLLEEIVVPVSFASPLAAANIEARAERTAKAAMRLAAKNPKVRRGIEKIVDGSDVFTVAMFPLTTAVCVMVDWGMMPPTSAPARAVGVPMLWETVYSEEDMPNGTNGHGTMKRGLLADMEVS